MNGVVRVGLIEKMTLGQRNDGDETVWQVAMGAGHIRQRGQQKQRARGKRYPAREVKGEGGRPERSKEGEGVSGW